MTSLGSRSGNDRIPISVGRSDCRCGAARWQAMSGTPRHDRADTLRGRPDAWSGLVWLLAVTAVCGIADYFALPDADVWFGMPLGGHELFRPEWLIMGTLVAYPLFRLARASLVLGVLGLLLAS